MDVSQRANSTSFHDGITRPMITDEYAWLLTFQREFRPFMRSEDASRLMPTLAHFSLLFRDTRLKRIFTVDCRY